MTSLKLHPSLRSAALPLLLLCLGFICRASTALPPSSSQAARQQAREAATQAASSAVSHAASSRRTLLTEPGRAQIPEDIDQPMHMTPSMTSASVLSMTIFCAPKPYAPRGQPPDNQRRALMSWLRLTSNPRIVLFGNDSSFYDLAREFPGRIEVEPRIDTNMYGVPLLNSIVARAQAANTDLSMFINSDIVLLNDMVLAVEKVRAVFRDWVLVSARWDVEENFPYSFEPSMWEAGGIGRTGAALEREIRTYARTKGVFHTYGGIDIWAWNNSPTPLLEGVIPPFAIGRGKYDNWFTHEMVVSQLRDVVDISEAVTAIHVAHSYGHVVESEETSNGKVPRGLSFWSTRKKSSWELYANIHMSQAYGSYTNQKGTVLYAPWKIASCVEPVANNMCLQKRLRPANCSCEYTNYVVRSQTDPKLDKRHYWTCGRVSPEDKNEYEINAVPVADSPPGLPHTLEQILPQVAREVVVEGGERIRVVTLVAVTIGYAEMLMSFVCRLRALGLADNLVVAALDEDLYKFAFTQGLPTYYEQVSVGLKNLDSADCAFGSQCFRQFTKLKSRAVLRVLRAGYAVLWTDVDIVWFKDPLPDLLSYGKGTLPVQSNEPKANIPGCGIRRINSGFYFARADKETVEAFAAITAHAATTKLSEQPSFYDVLCGPKGEYVQQGKEECMWPVNGLRTVFLDRSIYPNGAVHGLWDEPDVTAACLRRGTAILHNNWITGREAKMERMTTNGFWHYDAERRMCRWPWHSALPRIVPLRKSDAGP